jgi:hypothetical protein
MNPAPRVLPLRRRRNRQHGVPLMRFCTARTARNRDTCYSLTQDHCCLWSGAMREDTSLP